MTAPLPPFPPPFGPAPPLVPAPVPGSTPPVGELPAALQAPASSPNRRIDEKGEDIRLQIRMLIVSDAYQSSFLPRPEPDRHRSLESCRQSCAGLADGRVTCWGRNERSMETSIEQRLLRIPRAIVLPPQRFRECERLSVRAVISRRLEHKDDRFRICCPPKVYGLPFSESLGKDDKVF